MYQKIKHCSPATSRGTNLFNRSRSSHTKNSQTVQQKEDIRLKGSKKREASPESISHNSEKWDDYVYRISQRQYIQFSIFITEYRVGVLQISDYFYISICTTLSN